MRSTKKGYSTVALITLLGLGGCSNVSQLMSNDVDERGAGISQATENNTAVRDTTVAIASDSGIKIFYTLLGDLERIEVTGVAEAWKGNVEIRAEADAKDRLVKYLYEEEINSERSIEITTRTLDQARDNVLNQINDGLDVPEMIEFDRREVETELDSSGQINNQRTPDNTSRRVAERIEQTKILALTTITAKGKIRGMRKVNGELQQDGKLYVATYQWSEKDQATAEKIRDKMLGQ